MSIESDSLLFQNLQQPCKVIAFRASTVVQLKKGALHIVCSHVSFPGVLWHARRLVHTGHTSHVSVLTVIQHSHY